MELIINLRDEARHVFDRVTHRPRRSYRRSWLSGPHSEFIIIDTAPNASMIGAHFRPGGASAFFGLPLCELRNNVVDLESFWNRDAERVREQLLEAPNPPAKFRILEDALLERWRGAAPRHRAVLRALECFTREPQSVRIGEVTAEIGLSSRRFIQVFTEQVGMTPKVFCRVRRFQTALTEIQRPGEVAWVDIATACGYYDQAHFIHDFKEFCGITPGDYLDGCPAEPNFVPIAAR